MALPDSQTAVVVTRLRVMKADEHFDDWAVLQVTQPPVPKPEGKQVSIDHAFVTGWPSSQKRAAVKQISEMRRPGNDAAAGAEA